MSLENLQKQVNNLEIEILTLRTQLEAYRNAQGQVVNLAFSLIASGVVAIIVTSVFRQK